MDEPRDYRTKWSKSEKKKNDITYMWYHLYHMIITYIKSKTWYKRTYLENRLTDVENKLKFARG